MDDLSAQLNSILSDPQSLQQIQSVLGALGMNSPASPPIQAELPKESLPAAGLPAAGLPTAGPPTAGLAALAPLLGKVNQEDDSTRFLRALRPMLSDTRQHKLDEALRLLQMLRLLPLLRESGLF